ncbi:MAG: MarR family transcriptional regulator [Candidatus Omnitrophota bacterium]
MKKPKRPEKVPQQPVDPRSGEYWERIRKYGERYSAFDWPSVRLVLDLIYTYDVLMRRVEKRIASLGISTSSFNILMILSSNVGKGCRQEEISQLLLVSRANITGLIDHLVKKGLVKRCADPSDRRVWNIMITAKGEKLLASYLPGHYQEIRERLCFLSVKEKDLYSDFLTRLRESNR